MIQSHYVPSERPYRIIYTGGVVGLQIGTLIVVDDQSQYFEKTTIPRVGNRAPRFVGYLGVKTYSYPVVSYINKVKEKDYPVTSDIAYDERFYSESVVWNNVKMEDVATICLEGQKVPWDDMLSIIGPAIEKCIDLNTTRKQLTETFGLFSRIQALGGSISMPEGAETDYSSGGYTTKMYTVKLFLDSYKDEDGNETSCYRTDDGDSLPFFAIEGEEAYKILDYQRMMYERRIKLLDRSVGSQIKLYFEMIDLGSEEETQNLKVIVNKLNSRNH